MEEILKSILLEYEKSTFLIDLIKHNSGAKFIKIKQTVEGNDIINELKINSSVLNDIIFILQDYQKEVKQTHSNISNSYFSEEKQKSVIERYFKGITIEDLTLQFDCSKQIIEQILYNKGIGIVDNKQPQQPRKLRYKKRK